MIQFDEHIIFQNGLVGSTTNQGIGREFLNTSYAPKKTHQKNVFFFTLED